MNEDSFKHLSKHILLELSKANDALAITGLYFLSKKLFSSTCSVFQFIRTHVFSRATTPDLIKTYGGKWAVVTGSSCGIGKAYAEELAKRGLNLILISRDSRKLQQTAIQINEQYQVEVDFISITFDGDAGKYDRLKIELDKRDIGILVNNVGVMYDYPQHFLDVPSQRLWELVNVNIAATTVMTHLILPQMVERGKGAIVNLSAGGSSKPTPQMTVYAATKAYIDLFSRALNYEYKDYGITVQCLLPFYVGTKFSKISSKPGKLIHFIPSAECYASHAICTLGYSSRTCGYWLHSIQGCIVRAIPEWLWMWGASRLNQALRRQAKERLKSKSSKSLKEVDNG